MKPDSALIGQPQLMAVVQNLSILLLTPLVTAILMAAHELGRGIRWAIQRRKFAAKLGDGHVGQPYLQSSLGLLSLLIAFAFGAALERYNVRRDLVSREALLVEAYYMNLLRLPEPGRARLADGLIQYLDARIDYSAIDDDAQLARAVGASEATGIRLWLGVAPVGDNGGGAEVEAVVERATEMLSAASARRDALAAGVPPTIIGSVLLYALIVAGLMGYVTKPGGRFIGGPVITFILLALAISLVLELDGPRSGAIRVDQAPLVGAVKRIREFEALRRTAPPEPWLAAASRQGP